MTQRRSGRRKQAQKTEPYFFCGSLPLLKKSQHGIREESETELADCKGNCLQRAAIRHSSGLVVPAAVDKVLRSPGRAICMATRRVMQHRFHHDFANVRIHDDAAAAASAAAVAARAYTVGNHIVFGAGQFSEESISSHPLLAHELTHVIQQQRSSLLRDNPHRLEAEADRAESAYTRGDARVPVVENGVMLARNEDSEATADVETQAGAAESACDIRTLCQLRFRAPARVDDTRVRRAFSICHPSVSTVGLVLGSPCLTPNFGLPVVPGAAQPGLSPPASAGSSPAGSSGGLSLPSTTIRFRLGPVPVEIDLPSSLSMRLPVPFRGASLVVFTLNASTSAFSFSAAINAVPYVRITATVRMTTGGAGSAGLTIESRRRTCRAQEAASARAALQTRGEQVVEAIRAVHNPPPVPDDASTLERTFDPHMRMAEVVGAVAGLHSAIERSRAACSEVPVVTGELGVRGQLTRPGPGEESAPTYLGGGVTLHF